MSLESVYGKMGHENSQEWLTGYATNPERNDAIIESFANILWGNTYTAPLDFFAETTAFNGDLEAAVAHASRIRDPEIQSSVLKKLESYVEN